MLPHIIYTLLPPFTSYIYVYIYTMYYTTYAHYDTYIYYNTYTFSYMYYNTYMYYSTYMFHNTYIYIHIYILTPIYTLSFHNIYTIVILILLYTPASAADIQNFLTLYFFSAVCFLCFFCTSSYWYYSWKQKSNQNAFYERYIIIP